jgi:hypothetical protein
MINKQDTNFPQPFYYIIFSINNVDDKECVFKSLFLNNQGSLKYYMEREMTGFRCAGWGFPNNVQYAIQLDGIEYKDDSRRVKLFENGHILIQGAVSESFLCWANASRQSTIKGNRTQINTTALIEFTFNSVDLLKRSLEDCEHILNVECEFGFVGMTNDYVLGDEKLPGNEPFNISWTMNPIGKDVETSLSINNADIVSEEGVAKVTYSILARIYRMFGYSESEISFVNSGEKKIDINLIKGVSLN